MRNIEKKITALLIAFIMIFSQLQFGYLMADQNDKVLIEVSETEGSFEDEVEISVNISENSNAAAMNLDLSYDKEKLEVVTAVKEDAMNSGITDIVIHDEYVSLAYINIDGLEAGGNIMTITFKILEKERMEIPLEVSVLELKEFDEDTYSYPDIPYDTIDGAVTIIPQKYSVSFKDWDGTLIKTEEVEYNNDASSPADPIREGHTFTRWDTDFTNVTENITVTALYDVSTYTVTFEDWDGNVLKTEEVEHGNDAIAPQNPDNKEGHTFTRWDIDFTNVTGNLAVTALYDINTYTVTFEDWDGNVLKTEEVEHGNDAIAPQNPNSKEGYTFTRWDTDFTNIIEAITVKAEYDVNLDTPYAVEHYKQDITGDGYTLYETDNLTGTTNEEVAADVKIYEGFEENVDHANRMASGEISGDGSLVLKLYYDREKYTVTFKDYDDTVLYTDIVRYKGDVAAPQDPIREGYTFTGWDSSFENITEDIDIVATYGIDVYNVVFKDFDDAIISNQWIEYAQDAQAPDDPEREGYDFIEWDTDFTNVTDDIEVNAVYEINVYEVVFKDFDDETIDTQMVEYGNAALEPQEPEREGYTFISWDKPFDNIKDDLILNAEYEINQYEITFLDYNEEVKDVLNVDFDDLVSEPNVDDSDWYNLEGWYKEATFDTKWDFDNDKVPSNDLTLYSKWILEDTKNVSPSLVEPNDYDDENTPYQADVLPLEVQFETIANDVGVIYYSFDQDSWDEYTQTIVFNESDAALYTVFAKTYFPEIDQYSDINIFEFNIEVEKPSFSEEIGEYDQEITLYLETQNDGGEIFYTIGEEKSPLNEDERILYSNEGILLSQEAFTTSYYIKAVRVVEGKTSDLSEGLFTIIGNEVPFGELEIVPREENSKDSDWTNNSEVSVTLKNYSEGITGFFISNEEITDFENVPWNDFEELELLDANWNLEGEDGLKTIFVALINENELVSIFEADINLDKQKPLAPEIRHTGSDRMLIEDTFNVTLIGEEDGAATIELDGVKYEAEEIMPGRYRKTFIVEEGFIKVDSLRGYIIDKASNEGELGEADLLAEPISKAASLEGRIVDEYPVGVITPLEKVNVTISGQGIIRSTLTNQDGKFYFKELKPGDYELRVIPIGDYEYIDDVNTSVDIGEVKNIGDITLDKPMQYTVTVTVVDDQNNKIEDVYVSLSKDDFSISTQTGIDGKAIFENITEGDKYSIHVEPGGLLFSEKVIDNVSLAEDFETTVILEAGYVVKGIVSNGDDPLAGVEVEAFDFSGHREYSTTNTQGEFIIRGLKDNDYTLRIKRQKIDNKVYIEKEILNVTPKLLADFNEDIEIELKEAGKLMGRFVVEGTNNYISGVKGEILKDGTIYNWFIADSEGNVIVDGLESGEYQLNVTWSNGFSTGIVKDNITVEENQTVDLEDIELTRPYEGENPFASNIVSNVEFVNQGSRVQFRVDIDNTSNEILNNVEFNIELPDNLNLNEDSILSTLGGNIGILGKTINVELGTIEGDYSGEITFNAQVDQNVRSGQILTVNTEAVFLGEDNEEQRIDISTSSINVLEITLSGPNNTNQREITLYGKASADALVRIYLETVVEENDEERIVDIEIASIIARGDYWSTEVILPELGNEEEKTYILKARAEVGNEVSNSSEKISTTYREDFLKIEEVYLTSQWNVNVPLNTRLNVVTLAVVEPAEIDLKALIPGNPENVMFHFDVASDETISVQATKNGDEFTGTINLPEGYNGVRPVRISFEDSLNRQYNEVIAQIRILIDPSGRVFDSITYEPVVGAKATLEYKVDDAWQMWPAGDFNQINPQYTDNSGYYGWDVGNGTYRIRIEKDGYDTVIVDKIPDNDNKGHYKDEDIVVPPPRLDVNIYIDNIESAKVTEKSPVSDATDIIVNQDIEVIFDKNMDGTTINASTFIVKLGNTPVSGTYSYDENERKAVFTPDELFESNSLYEVTLNTGIEDVIGVPISDEISWSFTTKKASEISQTSPLDGAANIDVSTNISVTFDTEMDDTTINTDTILLYENGNKILGSVSYSNKTAIFNPSSNLQWSKTYEVRVKEDIKSIDGANIDGDYVFSFTTKAQPVAPPPIVLPPLTPELYTVNFDSNGGIQIESQEVESGEKATKPNDPTKEGFEFDGWYSDEALTIDWDFDTLVDKDITIYASWSEVIEDKHTVTFETDGGSAVQSQEVVSEEKVSIPNNPTKEGYEFDGWFSDEELTNDWDFDTLVDKDITIYASWSKIEIEDIIESIEIDEETNSADLIVNENEFRKQIKEKSYGTVVAEIDVETNKELSSLNVDIPLNPLREVDEDKDIELNVKSKTAQVRFDKKALKAISGDGNEESAKLNISKVDNSKLSEKIRETVSDRQVYSFNVTRGNDNISDFEGGIVEVSIPYELKAGEDENAVVVYYINSNGNLSTVRGRYIEEESVVRFTTTHFSMYMIGYNEVEFCDVEANLWYCSALDFIAARGIVNGIGGNKFGPNLSVRRSDFLIMAMNAFDIEVIDDYADNFADAGNKYYKNYLGTAKELGIAAGTGGNKFNPEGSITRQDMMVILYRILTKMDELPKTTVDTRIEDFSDKEEIKSYALPIVKVFVESGIIQGSNGRIKPKDMLTRAEAAKVIYNLMSK